MQEGEKKSNRKTVITTSVTSLVLLVLPIAAIPENLFFIIPGLVEFIAIGVLWGGAGYRANSTKRKKVIASQSLRRSIDDDIDALKLEIERAPNSRIAKILGNQLVELYKERAEESAVHRRDLREDIKKYGDDNRLLQAERESIQDNLVRKVGEELEKVSETLNNHKLPE